MTVKVEGQMQAGKARKMMVILVLFAIAIAFYAGSFFMMGG
ncbi:MAG: hypothetical protein ABFS22_03815 [Pseudomonadota bacterium]